MAPPGAYGSQLSAAAGAPSQPQLSLTAPDGTMLTPMDLQTAQLSLDQV